MTLLKETYQAPKVIDPETGLVEHLGLRRTLVLGGEGLGRVVTQPTETVDGDVLDQLVAEGELTHSS